MDLLADAEAPPAVQEAPSNLLGNLRPRIPPPVIRPKDETKDDEKPVKRSQVASIGPNLPGEFRSEANYQSKGSWVFGRGWEYTIRASKQTGTIPWSPIVSVQPKSRTAHWADDSSSFSPRGGAFGTRYSQPSCGTVKSRKSLYKGKQKR